MEVCDRLFEFCWAARPFAQLLAAAVRSLLFTDAAAEVSNEPFVLFADQNALLF